MSKKITSVIILLLSSVFVLSNSVSVSALNSAVYFEGGADNLSSIPTAISLITLKTSIRVTN